MNKLKLEIFLIKKEARGIFSFLPFQIWKTAMNRKGWERMLREIQCEKFAVGDYIALEKAEKIIKTIFGPKPRDEFLKKNQDNQVRNLSREQRKER